MDSKKETPRKLPEKKPTPPANNTLWLLLVVGVLSLIAFVFFFNPDNEVEISYSDLLRLIEANDANAKSSSIDVVVGSPGNQRSERLSRLSDIEIQSFKITGNVVREPVFTLEPSTAKSTSSGETEAGNKPASDVAPATDSAVAEGTAASDHAATEKAIAKPADKTATAVKVDGPKKIQFSTDRQPDEDLVAATLRNHGVPFRYAKGPSRWSSFLPMLLLTGLIVFVFIVMMRRLGGAGSPMAFGRSRGKLYAQEEIDIMFDDVAGIEEAVEEVREVVEFLRTPEKYQMLGGRIPKGILLVGPPGTGKTLLGKAIAGEAGVPFFSLSGSDFVEMFVGVGAARVRDMFQQAEAKAPCIIFIDELDALGKTRGSGAVGGHDEREQTLNALLVEMDGFDSNSGVIVLGATNRPETLDPALLRPGRFDRHVLVDRPDVAGRKEILEVHMRNVKVAPTVDVKQIAAITSGFVGADLANLVNEAALLAARNGKTSVGMQEFNEGVERVTAGLEKKQRIMHEEEKRRVAFHESGHALVAYSLPNTDPVHKVSIIPRGLAALGYTMQRPEQDRFLMTQGELESRIQVLLAGTIAEESVFEDVSTGAQNDLERATEIARAMVMDYGMSRLGRVTYRESARSPFLVTGGDTSARLHGFSEQTAREIDEEVKRIIDESMERVRHIIAARKDALIAMSMLLLEQEVIDADELREVMEKNSPSPRIVPGTDVDHKRPAPDTANIDASEFDQKEAN